MPAPSPSPWGRALVRTLCVIAFGAQAGLAAADGPLGANGSSIETSQYAIDLGAGPVVAGSRVMGLAGAYVAIAEDVDGNQHNPASPAVRPPYSLKHFDYHLGLGLSFPAALSSSDFFNTGGETTALTNRSGGTTFLTLAANLQWGSLGVGVTIDGQTYSLDKRMQAAGEGPAVGGLEATFGGARVQVANAFFGGQLVAGVGTRVVGMTIGHQGEDTLFDTRSTGYEAGVLIRPNGGPFRVGAAFESEVTTRIDPTTSMLEPNADGDIVTLDDLGGPIYLPRAVKLPWRLDLGMAYQWGPRPLNPRWIHPHRFDVPKRMEVRDRRRERRQEYAPRIAEARDAGDDKRAEALEQELEQAQDADGEEIDRFEEATQRTLRALYVGLPRRYLLVSAQLHMRGAVDGAVGVESFLQGTVNRSGQRVTLSPRLGVESEVLPDRLRLRAGTYYEPTRFRTSQGRVHGTLGLDMRVLDWSVFGIWPDWYRWRVGAVVDVAQRYFGWGLTLGGWY